MHEQERGNGFPSLPSRHWVDLYDLVKRSAPGVDFQELGDDIVYTQEMPELKLAVSATLN